MGTPTIKSPLDFNDYFYTEDDKLQDNAHVIAFGENINDGVVAVEHEIIERKCSMSEINAIVATMSILTNDKHLCSYTSGNYLGLEVILNGDDITDFKNEDWKVLVSPKLSHKRIANLLAHEVAEVLIRLNLCRELWKQSENNDASKYFS